MVLITLDSAPTDSFARSLIPFLGQRPQEFSDTRERRHLAGFVSFTNGTAPLPAGWPYTAKKIELVMGDPFEIIEGDGGADAVTVRPGVGNRM
ncbi:MAG: hypothetical protein LBC91_03950 [Candidatus Accumulibacter sp.]|jgi:hypothetical protein|nr:hypothetical protein [Accumulibacter sp.]